jgi:predicted nuclease of restriction endonuclease-like (RecB) superfamily
LKRQIGTSLFEWLLLSDGKVNKEKLLTLASEGISMSRPEDMLKEPYVFEFKDWT